MKKVALLALMVLLIPGVIHAQECQQDADSIRYHSAYMFPAEIQDIYPGQVLTFNIAICMYDWALDGGDTICMAGTSTGLLDLSGDINENSIYDPDPGDDGIGCWGFWPVIVEASCDVAVCEYDTVIITLHFTNTNYECDVACMDTSVGGRPDIDTLILHVVDPPPALLVLQDTLSYVEQGVTAAYVPFAVCNPDPCTPGDYEWLITSVGYVGGPISQGGAATVPGGDCQTVYGIIDASASGVCEYDTLTIVAWRGDLYDTCIQVIHIVEPIEVPLFTTPVVTILILAMILAAAVFLRRRATSRA
jgi:hypothetical protein